MVDAPVDTQAVLLLLHAALALAAVELAGEQGAHGAAALALGVGAQLVGAVARDALAQRAELGAAHGVGGAGLARLQAVPARADSCCHTFCKGRGEAVSAAEQPREMERVSRNLLLLGCPEKFWIPRSWNRSGWSSEQPG